MACRVGMTTDPEGRRQYWKSKHRNFRNWTILHRTRSKARAQQLESREAEARNCEYHPGGGGPDFGDWYVDYFQF